MNGMICMRMKIIYIYILTQFHVLLSLSHHKKNGEQYKLWFKYAKYVQLTDFINPHHNGSHWSGRSGGGQCGVQYGASCLRECRTAWPGISMRIPVSFFCSMFSFSSHFYGFSPTAIALLHLFLLHLFFNPIFTVFKGSVCSRLLTDILNMCQCRQGPKALGPNGRNWRSHRCYHIQHTGQGRLNWQTVNDQL